MTEIVYSSSKPAAIAAADYQGIYVAGVAALYVLPGFYLFAKKRGIIYIIWLLFATASIIMFFLNYANFCNIIAASYTITGSNSTLTIENTSGSCPNSETTICFYQTVESELTYNGIVYAITTYTNYYYSQPLDPVSPVSQTFATWDPLTQYNVGIIDMLPVLYLAISALMYGILIAFIIAASQIKKQQEPEAEILV
jgi:hypothetical protein